MRSVKDSVHDHVELGPVAADLLDTPALQRLRHVKQLSTVRLVYPAANHTRFEHSLGVYHLACEALDHLGVDDDRATAVRAAALLHDVGHGPYGHQTEAVIERRLGRHHDEVGHLLARDDVGAVLDAHGLDPDRVASLVAGEGELGQLVAGELDVDRMDYLVRDAHHTGVPYGTVDHGRLLRALRFVDGRLALAEGNVATAESTLVARALMNATVYRHHVSRIAGAMLERACERLLDADGQVTASRFSSAHEAGGDAERFARLTDAELLGELGRRDATAEAADRLATRRLYKRAVWAEHDATPDDVAGADHAAVREWERDIADAADVPESHVVVDAPGEPRMPESSTRVVVDGEVRRLHEQSPLDEALHAAERARWRLGVYAPEAETEAVERAAKRRLGL